MRVGQKAGAIDGSVKRVAVDTTVMEKIIAYPTDARHYERARAQLVVLKQEARVGLRQSYVRLAPLLALQVGRYAHAEQLKRLRKALRRQKGYTGRVMCNRRRQLRYEAMPAGDIHNSGTRLKAFRHNPRHNMIRPPADPPPRLNNIKPPDKPMLKIRHAKPTSAADNLLASVSYNEKSQKMRLRRSIQSSSAVDSS